MDSEGAGEGWHQLLGPRRVAGVARCRGQGLGEGQEEGTARGQNLAQGQQEMPGGVCDMLEVTFQRRGSCRRLGGEEGGWEGLCTW